MLFRKYLFSAFINKQITFSSIVCERNFRANGSRDEIVITKMATSLPWREAASVIIAAKCSLKDRIGTNLTDLALTRDPKSASSRSQSKFDYRILMLKRSVLSSFMANAYVFPGGVIELSEYSLRWWDVFSNAGVSREELEQFSLSISGPRPPMFNNSVALSVKGIEKSDCFPPDLAVRISAIRETFEETGILLLTSSELREKQEVSTYTSNNINLRAWREKIHHNPEMFLDLCFEARVCPNIWCMQEWWNWLTPANIGHRRYDTMFYVCCLSKMPEAQADQTEIASLKWYNPEEILEENASGSLFLAPPQIYELSRFLNFHHIQDLHKFCKQREFKGVERWMPVIASATDGAISLLPGDDLYPEKPDVDGETSGVLDYPYTLNELRNKSHNLNRLEISGIICSICSNIMPMCNHAQPTKYPSNVPVIQSYL